MLKGALLAGTEHRMHAWYLTLIDALELRILKLHAELHEWR